MTDYKLKLIEVALPLEAINRASAHEKSIRHGHPSTLHLWWARRPLAACRAVLFASLVDDPSAHPDEFPTEEAQEAERQRLFRIIEDLAKWGNATNDEVLAAASAEIMRSTDGNPPPVLDPFCGGGSIPLEAQRLGLDARGSDLNPVAVLLTKSLIEIPPKFTGMSPVNPQAQARLGNAGWRGAHGMAEDVRYYGQWMRDEAERRIGHLYPNVVLPGQPNGAGATVIAWLWARTVTCPNPACGAEMPLVRSFALSNKKNKQVWVEPVVDGPAKTVRFEVRTGVGVAPAGTVSRNGARCLVCGSSVRLEHIRNEGRAGRMGVKLMAVAGERKNGRVYVAPDDLQVQVAETAEPEWMPDGDLPKQALGFRVQLYGMTKYRHLFTKRQLTALTTLCDLIAAVRLEVLRDAEVVWANLAAASVATATPSTYADAISTYLAFAVDRTADRGSSICTWDSSPKMEALRNTFGRQAIPMTWDFAEGNPFSESSGSWNNNVDWVSSVLANLVPGSSGVAHQLDAAAAIECAPAPLISTDPPYYDNIGYADLSDFFYVWLRHCLRGVYPDLFSTLQTPKTQELVADQHRFGGSQGKAQSFFEHGLGSVFERIAKAADPAYPMTVYYAFKQTESRDEGALVSTASTGWETMLAALLKAGFVVVGTWPVRSELGNRMRNMGSNALASSIVLVCRPRMTRAPLATRKEFIAALRSELPDSLRKLQHGNIAPVDLAQASIGPGMAVFSRYSRVVEADGSAMTVRTALALINQALDEVLAEQEGEFDGDTRWAIGWFEQVGVLEGEFGTAETLCKAKNCSVQGLVEAGIVVAKAGKVRLLRYDELDEGWNPATDVRLTVWEMAHHLVRRLDEGEAAAADLVRLLGSNAEIARDLAYRLYLVCERKKWSQEGQAYNALVVAWPEIQRLAAAEPASAGPSQTSFEV